MYHWQYTSKSVDYHISVCIGSVEGLLFFKPSPGPIWPWVMIICVSKTQWIFIWNTPNYVLNQEVDWWISKNITIKILFDTSVFGIDYINQVYHNYNFIMIID